MRSKNGWLGHVLVNRAEIIPFLGEARDQHWPNLANICNNRAIVNYHKRVILH